MPANKRITDLTDYISTLPYASELFGVYQPMIGWKSKRIKRRFIYGLIESQGSLLKRLAQLYEGISDVHFPENNCSSAIRIYIGKLKSIKISKNNNSVLLQSIVDNLPKDKIPEEQEWETYINHDVLEKILNTNVKDFYTKMYNDQCVSISNIDKYMQNYTVTEKSFEQLKKNKKDLEIRTRRLINEESAIAVALLGILGNKLFAQLEDIFYEKIDTNLELDYKKIFEMVNNEDPFLTFDPKKDIKHVCLSPLGIVHLFRQYFFELDTFLGTPTGHIWLSPGSTVELVEVSTRRTLTEQMLEVSTESIIKTETSTTNQDEISEAVKKDNKNDLKLGASATVNQSWVSGSATATASLNKDKTQQIATEVAKKHMRQQSEKLSTEIRQNYKSTFKTVTEVTDTSSKRYVLNNTTQDLINYELRRKMRQVGVQVQDVGTYLCWETFVDEPGKQLGLANLVHIAKPVDLVSVPDLTQIPYPENKPMIFTARLIYNHYESQQINGPDGFLPLGTLTFGTELPDIPDGYIPLPETIKVEQLSATGTDFQYIKFPWSAKIVGKEMTFGIKLGELGYDWDNQIDFVVGTEFLLTASPEKRKEIDKANEDKLGEQIKAKTEATLENLRMIKEAFIKDAKERIELASKIDIRKYEDLREEERIIIYRNLIKALMSDYFYNITFAKDVDNANTLHIISELINSIFDVDKMLYFVAPEWWKPREHNHQYFGENNNGYFSGNLTYWGDQESRSDNYYITEKSRYAKMGSSLGWLLQLDGDDLRNAFLNAPWVKAVIPIRPGKELEAINWLQQMNIEGTDGLDNLYQAPNEELNRIRTALGINNVTIRDAIKVLCADVAIKHQKSLEVGKYPDEEINDDNKVTATPIDRVYEHGFYPLKGGFRAVVEEDFKICTQWIEVLPTDQVVPVEVKYNPKTGRQI